MQGLLEKTFYSNTITEWLIAFAIIFGSAIIAKLTYYIFSRFVKALTKKTKNKFDDIIVDMVEEPVVFAIIIAGIWYGFKTLTLSEALSGFIHNAYFFLVTFNIAWFINRMIDAIIREYLAPLVNKSEGDLDDQLLPIISKGMKLVVWSVAVIVALNNAGYDVGALIAGLGIGGLAFAMAAKDSVANLFGGVTIFVDKPFILKDRIRIKGFDGTVNEIGIRSTRLITLDGRMVTIPNSVFASDAIENVTSEPSRKVPTSIGLIYDTKPEAIQQAMDILREIATKHENIDENIKIAFTSFGDFSMNILFIYYIIKDRDILQTQTDVNLAILQQFSDAGLEMAFPTQTIYNIASENN